MLDIATEVATNLIDNAFTVPLEPENDRNTFCCKFHGYAFSYLSRHTNQEKRECFVSSNPTDPVKFTSEVLFSLQQKQKYKRKML